MPSSFNLNSEMVPKIYKKAECLRAFNDLLADHHSFKLLKTFVEGGALVNVMGESAEQRYEYVKIMREMRKKMIKKAPFGEEDELPRLLSKGTDFEKQLIVAKEGNPPKCPDNNGIPGKHILSFDLSDDGNRLFSGSSSPPGEVLVWDVKRHPKKVLHRLPPLGWTPPTVDIPFNSYKGQARYHSMPVTSVKLLGDLLATASLDGTIIIWENLMSSSARSPPKPVHVLYTEAASVSSLAADSMIDPRKSRIKLSDAGNGSYSAAGTTGSPLAPLIISSIAATAAVGVGIGIAMYYGVGFEGGPSAGIGIAVGVAVGLISFLFALLMRPKPPLSEPIGLETGSLELGFIPTPTQEAEEAVVSASLEEGEDSLAFGLAPSEVTEQQEPSPNLNIFGLGLTEQKDCSSWLPQQPDFALGGLLNAAQPSPSDRQRGIGFTSLAIFPLEGGDVPSELVDEANKELKESLQAEFVKHEEATGGDMLFAGDESGTVTVWIVLPNYFTLAPAEESDLLDAPAVSRASLSRSASSLGRKSIAFTQANAPKRLKKLTPRPVKVRTLSIGATQMVTCLAIDSGRLFVGGQKGTVVVWGIDAILSGTQGDGGKLSSSRCTTRISALAVSGNQLFAGCLGSFCYPAGFVIEYLEDDGSWTRGVIIDVNAAADAKTTTYNIIANPEYNSSKNPEDFADWYINAVPASRMRTIKNEDDLAHVKKQVQQLITSTAETIDGAVMAVTASPDSLAEVPVAGPNQIEKPAELKVFLLTLTM